MKKYYSTEQIVTIKDVKEFFHHLVFDMNICFHPDDSFNEITPTNYLGFFSPNNMVLYDMLMDKCWDICEETKIDIYELGIKYIKKRFL